MATLTTSLQRMTGSESGANQRVRRALRSLRLHLGIAGRLDWARLRDRRRIRRGKRLLERLVELLLWLRRRMSLAAVVTLVVVFVIAATCRVMWLFGCHRGSLLNVCPEEFNVVGRVLVPRRR